MHQCCKNIDITDWKTIQPWIYECLERHYTRFDFKKLMTRIGKLSYQEYYEIQNGQKNSLDKASEFISKEAADRIRHKDLKLNPVRIREKRDNSSLKVRFIGIESAMQQIFDYIAVRSCDEIWRRRIVPQQASSIKDRGPAYGVSMISKWISRDNRAYAWAKSHNSYYNRTCKYHVKLDAEKCYQSHRCNLFLQNFSKDCGNSTILWLWRTLLISHQVILPNGNKNEGFMIGALVSQYASQYMLSYVYRYAMDLHYYRRGKQIKLVSHMMMFMDDMQLFSSSKKSLKLAIKYMTTYAYKEFKLVIKPKWDIQDINKTPVDIMGYKIYSDGNIAIRSRVFVRARRVALRSNRKNGISLRQALRLNSYKGFFVQKNNRYHLPLKSFGIRKKLNLDYLFQLASYVISTHERTG